MENGKSPNPLLSFIRKMRSMVVDNHYDYDTMATLLREAEIAELMNKGVQSKKFLHEAAKCIDKIDNRHKEIKEEFTRVINDMKGW